ncbi:hypothetical protein BV22DRAFT_112587 [Leucogyrophana mollusca]|uniref:Uncharacterized protein n=1 Tax=Leucogyrophana mollusca TaxID=85980 RepID=A0ACB8BUG5_9AGAM|nr:hypothetical protein BV22DRAFT_112587 [Leucogyrophana mollusca]
MWRIHTRGSLCKLHPFPSLQRETRSSEFLLWLFEYRFVVELIDLRWILFPACPFAHHFYHNHSCPSTPSSLLWAPSFLRLALTIGQSLCLPSNLMLVPLVLDVSQNAFLLGTARDVLVLRSTSARPSLGTLPLNATRSTGGTFRSQGSGPLIKILGQITTGSLCGGLFKPRRPCLGERSI